MSKALIREDPILWNRDSAYLDIHELRKTVRRLQIENRAILKALEHLMEKKYGIKC